jgi:hypothetical protein
MTIGHQQISVSRVKGAVTRSRMNGEQADLLFGESLPRLWSLYARSRRDIHLIGRSSYDLKVACQFGMTIVRNSELKLHIHYDPVENTRTTLD